MGNKCVNGQNQKQNMDKKQIIQSNTTQNTNINKIIINNAKKPSENIPVNSLANQKIIIKQTVPDIKKVQIPVSNHIQQNTINPPNPPIIKIPPNLVQPKQNKKLEPIIKVQPIKTNNINIPETKNNKQKNIPQIIQQKSFNQKNQSQKSQYLVFKKNIKNSKQSKQKICIKTSRYDWIMIGIIHTQYLQIKQEQIWKQKCIFLNLGTGNIWQFGQKIGNNNSIQKIQQGCVIEMEYNLQTKNICWLRKGQTIAQLKITKQIVASVQWIPFIYFVDEDKVQFLE